MGCSHILPRPTHPYLHARYQLVDLREMLRLAGLLRRFGNRARANAVARKRQAPGAIAVLFTRISYPLEATAIVVCRYRRSAVYRMWIAFGGRIRSPSANMNYAVIRWGRGAVGSAPRWHRGGRGFESHRLHQFSLDSRFHFRQTSPDQFRPNSGASLRQ